VFKIKSINFAYNQFEMALMYFIYRTRVAVMLLVLGWIVAGSASAAQLRSYTLNGRWEQGSLLIGKTTPDASVKFNGQLLKLDPQGRFVFGIDRDAAHDATLSVQLPGKPAVVERQSVAVRKWSIQRIQGLPPDKVNPPAEVEARIAAEAQLIKAAHARDSDLSGFAESFQWPVRGRVSGIFGSQRILNGVPKQPHFGLDVAVPTGTRVAAPASGVISLAQPDLYFTGGTIIVDHGHGVSSVMVHLSKLLVKVGDSVRAGQVVAESGMTGRATGPHLHWGVYWFESHVDPQRLVPP
jgi:murein DD-endopeptidase MepM/ murein hydrolase activator NlpD